MNREQLAKQARALGLPVRVQILEIIADYRTATVEVIIREVGSLTGPTISHHLRKLREAGLIECERRSTWVHYRLADGAVEELADAIRELRGP